MAALATAFVRVLGDTKGLQPSVVAGAKGAGAGGGKAGGKAFRGAFLGGLKGIAGPLAAIIGAKAVFGFFKDSISAASDLGESINAVQVVFGNAADGILKLSKKAATGVGLSKDEFNGLAVQFSAFAKTIAGKGGDVTGTIDGITKRAADFASVMNLDVAEAARLFQSGLAGETEPLRRFGIDLSAAAVKAHAYESGIAAAGEELTEQQKVQARYSLLLEQTNQVQGDFANTSGSLANQQRILGARWQNLKATLGRALLPAVTAIVSKFNEFLPTLIDIGRNVGKVLGPALSQAGDFLRELFSSADSGQGVMSGLRGAFEAIWDVVRQLLPILRDYYQTVIPAVASAFGTVLQVVHSLLPTVRDLANQVIAVLGPALRDIGKVIATQVIPAFKKFLVAAQPVLDFLIRTIGVVLVGAFKAAVAIIKGALKIIIGVLKVFTGVFTGDWDQVWSGIKQIFSGVWDAIKGVFKAGLEVMIALGGRLFTVLRAIFSRGWSAIKAIVSAAVDTLRSTISGAWNAVKDLTSSAWTAVRNFIRRAWKEIKRVVSNGIEGVLGFFRKLPGRVLRALGNLGKTLFNKGKQLIQGLIDGVKSLAGNVGSAVKGAVTGAVGKVGDFLGFGGGGRGGVRSPAGSGRILPPGSFRIGRGSSAHGYLARDLPAATGTPVFAPFAGFLINRSVRGSYGNHVRVRGAGVEFLGAHLSRFARRSGLVNMGDLIGFVGSTGNSTGPHLHVEASRNGVPVLPSSILKFAMGGFARRGGLAMVGELGRELVAFGQDAHVFSNRQTEEMLRGLAMRDDDTRSVHAPVFIINGTSEEVIARIQSRMAYDRIAREKVSI